MATFHYRAVRLDGSPAIGELQAASRDEALAQIRRAGSAPIELVQLAAASAAQPPRRASAKDRAAANVLIGELAVLLDAGLPLDRALALAIGNIDDRDAALRLAGLLQATREGTRLSRAMAEQPGLFSPEAVAMAEAGETNGRLGDALGRLSAMLEQAAELRRLITTSMIYPAALLLIAVGVILMMLLFVVPQFESLLSGTRADLPAASLAILAASRLLRAYGLWLLLGLVLAGFGAARLLRHPTARARRDALLLRLPAIGELVRRINTARFAHTLGALLEGDVPLPSALALAQRTIANRRMASSMEKVVVNVREGGGLTAPIAAARILPPLAIGFLRTGEETSQLGMMLTRLAVVLDRDVRIRLQRLIAVMTPAITVLLGGAVAAIIAAIMSAILGFNDLAVAP
jgi:general secretion pathway protein F